MYILMQRRAGNKRISRDPYVRSGELGRPVGVTNPVALPEGGENYEQSLTEKEILASVIQ